LNQPCGAAGAAAACAFADEIEIALKPAMATARVGIIAIVALDINSGSFFSKAAAFGHLLQNSRALCWPIEATERPL
jgi:hypothetical protein